MEDVTGLLEAARDAHRRHDWAAARDRFGAARAAGELAAADLEALADAAWWLGDLTEASAVLEEAYRRRLDDGRPGPAAALERVHAALAPGGTFVMVEPRASSRLEGNLGNPLAPWLYAVSTLHCLTVSLAGGGAGLGTAWGEELARAMLADAGFGEVTVHEAPGDPLNAVFVAAKPGA